jgi:2-amino-4-hydroxy-6-hydroxymethyldihydropteridine diphosphokinase
MRGFIALGSNLGDRWAHLRSGLVEMARAGIPAVASSSVWETEPVDTGDSYWFLNMVVRIETETPPLDLLELLLEVERREGRIRTERNAPRVLDLDLLLLGDYRLEGPRLTLPHPRMWERRFVLAPLAELAPDLRNSDTGLTVVESCTLLGDRPGVRRLGVLAAAVREPV